MPFASKEDYAVCRKLHKEYGSTYYLSSRVFPEPLKSRTDAIYGFVRTADEWVDSPGDDTNDQMRANIEAFRQELIDGLAGKRPTSSAMRAFVDVVKESPIPIEEPMVFLDAMVMDIDIMRYETFTDLCGYMRGSAASVGIMMAHASHTEMDADTQERATTLANAMQLTNFLRDIAEDATRGRIYIPLEDLKRFDVSEEDILNSRCTPEFKKLMVFQIERAREMYAHGEKGIPKLPHTARRAVRIARVLYSRILDRIEMQNYDVFTKRARTSRIEKLWIAAKLYVTT